MNDGKKRLVNADVLKGLLIVAIVFIHLLIGGMAVADTDPVPPEPDPSDPVPPGPEPDPEPPGPEPEKETGFSIDIVSTVVQMFYLGLMAFFILSGYFFKPGRGFADNMRRRFFQLVLALAVCIVALPLLTYAWMALLGKAPGLDDILLAFQWGLGMNGVFEPLDVFTSHPICGGCVGYYYLWGMFWGFIVFYAVADSIRDDWRRSLATVLILLTVGMLLREFLPIKLPMYLQLAPISASFMVAGMMMAKHGVMEKIGAFSYASAKSWAVLVCSIVASLALVILLPPGLDFTHGYGGYGGVSIFPFFVESVAMFVVMAQISLLLSKIPLFSDAMVVAGRHTLGILLLHGSVATMIVCAFYDITNGDWFPGEMGLYQRLAVAIIVLIVCILVCEVGGRVLGKRKENGVS